MSDSDTFDQLTGQLAVDMATAERLGLTIAEYTPQIAAYHEALWRAGHRCLNPLTCTLDGAACEMAVMYGTDPDY